MNAQTQPAHSLRTAQPLTHIQLSLPFLLDQVEETAAPVQDYLPGSKTVDLRPEIAIALHDLGEYRLPETNRAGMMVELLARNLYRDGDQHYPGWDIRMNFSWNRNGRSRDGHETSRIHDDRWKDAIDNDPSIFHMACNRALEPWVEHPVDLLDMDGALECEIDLLEPGRDTLILRQFHGEPMGFASQSDWREHVRNLDDTALADLWMSFRVLDSDLSRRQRAEIMAGKFNEIRAEMEADWDCEVEDLSF